jgi:cysteine desulfurase
MLRGSDVAYLDNNATTRPAPEVAAAMCRYLENEWGNPSSVHCMGQVARAAIDEARAHVAALVGCRDFELTFTGGGTEASNCALRGLFKIRRPRSRVVTSTVEHSATKALCRVLAEEGAQIVAINVDELGRLDMNELAAAVNEETALVSMIWANNETGVLFEAAAIAELCRRHKVPFHCDATQAIGKIPVNFAEMGIDCATLAAHKFHGPKGVGALFVRRGLRIPALIVGGPQERERRGGTENVPGIVGMGEAARLALEHLKDMARVAALRDDLERRILSTIADTRVNGDTAGRLPNTTNIGFAPLEAEAILLVLSEKGICASAGAACSSGSLEASPVLRAMKVPEEYAHGSIRFSMSRYTTQSEIDRVVAVLPEVISRLRAITPTSRRHVSV